MHRSAVREHYVQVEAQGEQVKVPSALTIWKNPVAQTHWPLLRTLLSAVTQEVQTVADEQVRQRVGQAEQMAVPDSYMPLLQAQLLVVSLVAVSYTHLTLPTTPYV